MIKNKKGETFEYEGRKFTVGELVYANGQSDYEGLFGYIKEIRTDADKDTENETADIYCEFMPPIFPAIIDDIEKRFSKLYGCSKKLEDLALDEVIMIPDMLILDSEITSSQESESVFCVTEDWAYHGDRELKNTVFRSLPDAQIFMRRCVLMEIMEDNIPFNQRGEEGMEEDSSEMFFEIYEDGDYNENHYSIQIEEQKINEIKAKKS